MLEFGLDRLHNGDFRTAKKHFRAVRIIGKLRQPEVELAKGQTVGKIATEPGFTGQSYYR